MIASCGLFSGNGRVSFASRAAEGRSISCVPRSAFKYNNCVPVLYCFTGVKLESLNVYKLIRRENRKDLLDFKTFKFLFQKKIPTENISELKETKICFQSNREQILTKVEYNLYYCT
jgi:hypothetical protein